MEKGLTTEHCIKSGEMKRGDKRRLKRTVEREAMQRECKVLEPRKDHQEKGGVICEVACGC